jgi:hypothetical protein
MESMLDIPNVKLTLHPMKKTPVLDMVRAMRKKKWPVVTVQMVACLLSYAAGMMAIRGPYYQHVTRTKYVLLLLPIIPLVATVILILRRLFKLDEMWRKILTESMAFAGLATAFTCFSLGFVPELGVRPEWGFEIFWVYYALGAAWQAWRLR